MDNPDFSSPKRINNMIKRMESTPTSPPLREMTMYPWNWGLGAQEINLSPASSCGSPDVDREADRLKRGRPRADKISSLIVDGSTVNSSIKCKVCNRVFPREKSLQAHMRTHTGERPYVCDYPNCGRAFCQSGQLKTHQRLHTGEKPFICSSTGCTSRFTHANRHCSEHPTSALKRLPADCTVASTGVENSPEVQDWFKRYSQYQQERTPQRFRSRNIKRSLHQDIENQGHDSLSSPVNARKRLTSASELAVQEPKRLVMDDDTCGVAGVKCLDGSTVSMSMAVLTGQQTNIATSTVVPISSRVLTVRQPNSVNPIQPAPIQLAESPLPVEKSWIGEQRDRILGALALVQLAQAK